MMDDQKDDFDDFDDEFFDDDFDDGVAGDVSEDLGSPDSFGDDWDFDEQQKPAKSKKAAKKVLTRSLLFWL